MTAPRGEAEPRPSDACGEALDRFAALLDDELAALRAMDAAKVVLCGEEKAKTIAEIAAIGIGEEHAPRLAELKKLQERNVRLLVHARDCTHDALVAVGAVASGYGRGKPSLPPGATIDVRG